VIRILTDNDDSNFWVPSSAEEVKFHRRSYTEKMTAVLVNTWDLRDRPHVRESHA